MLGLLLFSHLVSADDLASVFKKCSFNMGARKIEAYVADDDAKRERGLMHVEKLPENTGMLFIFEEARPLGFWMKNTKIPLAIGFFDSNLKLAEVLEMKIPDSVLQVRPPSYTSRESATFALEMNKGWFTQNKVTPGNHLSLNGNCASPLLNSQIRAGQKTRQ